MSYQNNKRNGSLMYKVILLAVVLMVLIIYTAVNHTQNDTLVINENFKSLPDQFLELELKSGIIIESSNDIHSIYYKELANAKYTEGKELDLDTVLFKIELSDLYNDGGYTFDKNKMNRIAWKDIKKGDLVYYYKPKNAIGLETKDIKAIIVVNQKIYKDYDKKYNNYIEDDLNLVFDADYYQITNLDDEWQIFLEGTKFLYDYSKKSPELRLNDFYDLRSKVEFKYIPSAFDVRNIEILYVTDVDRKFMRTTRSIQGIFESSEKLDEGYEVKFKLSDENEIQKKKTSSITGKYTLDRLDTDELQKGDKIVLYINPMNRIEAIKPIENYNNVEMIFGELYDKRNFDMDREIFVLEIIKVNGEKIELIADYNILEDDFTKLENNLCEFEVIDDNYLVGSDIILK